ncbi:MAG TPA: TIGR02679 domain-containing protein [Actinoallomurus sp.]|nr:TIGR02679 domain-containing protein [Actinoallomurus sp.]
MPLPVLADRATGDTKALNNRTPLSKLVPRALAARTGVEMPEGAEHHRALWDRLRRSGRSGEPRTRSGPPGRRRRTGRMAQWSGPLRHSVADSRHASRRPGPHVNSNSPNTVTPATSQAT